MNKFLKICLKFCPTPNTIDKSTLKEDLEKFGRKLRLKWHYRNDNRIFDPNPFKPKSKFNPPKSDAAIELYLSRLEEKLLNLGPIKHKYNNLTREERKALYDLRNDTSIIIKEADKGSVVVIWDKEDYLKEAKDSYLVKICTRKLQMTRHLSWKLCIGYWRKFGREVILIVIL